MAKQRGKHKSGETEGLHREPVRPRFDDGSPWPQPGTGKSFVVAAKVPAPYGSEPGTRWVRAEQSPATKAGFTGLQFGYRLDQGAWKWTGVLIESKTGLTGRRLREVPKIVNLVDLARGLLDLGQPVAITAPRQRGRHGHPAEFWQQMAQLRRRALRAAPNRHVVWMHANLPAQHSKVSLETVRRWDRLIRRGKKP